MPRGQHKDVQATEAMNFKNEGSFIALDGRMFLAGEDWKAQKQRVFFRDKAECQWCHRNIDAAYEEWDADHIQKRSKGGSDDLSNLRLIHRWSCHFDRHPEFQPRWTPKEAR